MAWSSKNGSAWNAISNGTLNTLRSVVETQSINIHSQTRNAGRLVTMEQCSVGMDLHGFQLSNPEDSIIGTASLNAIAGSGRKVLGLQAGNSFIGMVSMAASNH